MVRTRQIKPKPTASVSLEEWANQGRQHLAAGRYKEAIDAFKWLCKQDEGHDEWPVALSEAYLGQAQALATQGLYAEALGFLDKLQALGPKSATKALYITCLLASGKHEQAVLTYLKSAEDLQPEENDQLQTVFAAHIAAGQEQLLTGLPEHAPLVKHYAAVNGALEAFCSGKDEEAYRFLNGIPYRSPYRDLRTILSALMARSSAGRTASSDKLARVAERSPFAGLANVLRAIEAARRGGLATVSELAPAAKQYALLSLGIDHRTFGILEKIHTANDSPKQLLKVLTSHARLFDAQTVQRICLAVLPSYPDGIGSYSETFGRLSDFEQTRIHALAFEHKHVWQKAFDYWEHALGILSREDGDHDHRLRCALIARHLAEIQKNHITPFSSNMEELLSFSLEQDPDDKDSFIGLLQYYKDVGLENGKRHRDRMEQAVKQFPKDSDVLLAAVEMALARNAFKKAAGYAKTVLKLDPINSRARSLLLEAHLSHARKQIKAGRTHLAKKELDAAQSMERESSSAGIIHIHRGLLAFAEGNVEEGELLVEEACRTLGSYRIAYFQLLIAAQRTELASRAIKKYRSLLKQNATAIPKKTEILALIRAIEACIGQDDVDLGSTLALLTGYLKKGAELPFSLEEMETLCAAFERLAVYEMLRTYTQQACLRWDTPLFTYYRLVAKASGNLFALNPSDTDVLEEALEEATERSETDTIQRIGRLLEQFHDTGLKPESERLRDEIAFDADPSPETILEALLGKILFNGEEARRRR